MIVGAVLGNGPSRKYFDYQGEVTIGCNIPGEGYSVDATVISEVEIVWVLASNPDLITCPLIVSTSVHDKLDEIGLLSHYDIHHVFKPRKWFISAHYAALFLTNIIKCDKINIWGCDLFFEENPVSPHYVTKTTRQYYKQWKFSWNEIFRAYPSVFYSIKQV